MRENFFVTPSLSPLEIELHDRKAEHECESHSENHMHHCHNPQEVMMEAKVLRNELGHGLVSTLNLGLDITKLGGNQTI